MPSPSNLPEFFQHEVFPRLAVEAVYADVEFTASDGRYWRGLCPWAPKKGAAETFWVDAETLRWFCLDHCGRGGQSPLAYLAGGHFPQAGTDAYRAAVEKAAALAAVVVPDLPHPSLEDEHRLIQQERVASLLETFFFHAHRLLLDTSSPAPARQAALDFLAEHGFDPADLADLPVGLFLDAEAMQKKLEEAGFSAQEIDASELAADQRLPGRLVGPIRDPQGGIVSFWARHPEDQPPRFLFKGKWRDEIGLFGLDMALRPTAGGDENLVVVEHLLDTVLLQSKGIWNVAAIAGQCRDFGENRWRRLADLGLRRVTLALDQVEDYAGVTELLDAAFRVRPPFEIYLLLLDGQTEHRSTAEMLRACDAESFSALLAAHGVHAYSYRACAILERHKAGQPWTEARRHAAWKEAIEFYVLSGPENAPRLDEHFVPVIVAGLGRTWETFEPCGRGEETDEEEIDEVDESEIQLEETSEEGPGEIEETQDEREILSAEDPISHTIHKPQPEPAAEPAPLPPQEDTLPPATNASTNGRGFCPLHRCPATTCFCFD